MFKLSQQSHRFPLGYPFQRLLQVLFHYMNMIMKWFHQLKRKNSEEMKKMAAEDSLRILIEINELIEKYLPLLLEAVKK